MPNTIPTRSEIVTQLQEALRDRCNVTDFSESSIANTLIQVVASRLSDLYQRLYLLEYNTNLSTAQGTYLDAIGELYGIKRNQSKAATTLGGGNSVVFTNSSASPLVVGSGTRVWTRDSYQTAYRTLASVTVPAAVGGVSGRAYADVTSIGSGSSYNVAANSLTNHNNGSSYITVNNVRAITNGTEQESDDNYRFRIKNALSARGFTRDALYTNLIALPGVREVVVQNFARGAGTIDVIIVPVDRLLDQTVLDNCQSVAEATVAPGISVRCLRPIERPVDIEVKITTTPTANRTTSTTLAAGAIRLYMDNLSIGTSAEEISNSDIVLSTLVTAIRNSSIDIVDAVITSLKVDGRKSMLSNQKASAGELFYLQSYKVL